MGKVTLNDVLCNVRCTCEPKVAILSGKKSSQGPYNQSQCLSEYTSVYSRLLGGWGRGLTVLRLRWTSPIPIQREMQHNTVEVALLRS